MSKNIVLKAENVAKQYRLGEVGTGTLSHDLNRWWANIRGKEDPYLKIGESNDRTQKGSTDYVWALQDINFQVEKGQALGIIGKNGAGKSTLLKLLSKVTKPTLGEIKVKGRIASLLEVGTGFHPEMTGRENIYLNGAILGMTRKEVSRKFDEIVSFAGVERYVDTPVKRYSSGMYVRLAFAVAAHLESEILIVDEVLAVGDAEFQKKCLGKMGDVTKGEGRTILFVSHNMAAIRELCDTSLILEQGKVLFQGGVEEATTKYISSNLEQGVKGHYIKHKVQNKEIELLEAYLCDEHDNKKFEFTADEEIIIKMNIRKLKHTPKTYGYIVVKNLLDECIIESDTFDFTPTESFIDKLPLGDSTCKVKIPKRVMPNGTFIVYLNFASQMGVNAKNYDNPKEILQFTVNDTETPRGPKRRGYTSAILEWNLL